MRRKKHHVLFLESGIMKGHSRDELSSVLEDRFGPSLQRALGLLLEAYDYAQAVQRNLWDFAVEIEMLRAEGATNIALRLLMHTGYIELATESTRPEARQRSFRRTGNLITPQTCLVLTKRGADLVRKLSLADKGNRAWTVQRLPYDRKESGQQNAPRWDSSCRALWARGHLVKQFRQPAPCQELILASFEEEQWPPHIDDPLPPTADHDPKRRLHETVTNLNRYHNVSVIRFQGDGHGQGIRWEMI
jgi:hypothetical protein